MVEGVPPAAAPHTVANDDPWARRAIDSGAFDAERGRQLDEIRLRQRRYRGGAPLPPLQGRTVIVVDDGVATGATMRAALEACARPAPRAWWRRCRWGTGRAGGPARGGRKVVCLNTPAVFGAVGAFYLDFTQTGDEEVLRLLRAAAGGAAP